MSMSSLYWVTRFIAVFYLMMIKHSSVVPMTKHFECGTSKRRHVLPCWEDISIGWEKAADINSFFFQVWSCALSSDSSFLVSGSEDKTIRLWDMKTFKCTDVLTGHTDIVTSCNFFHLISYPGSLCSTHHKWFINCQWFSWFYTSSVGRDNPTVFGSTERTHGLGNHSVIVTRS